MQRNSMAAGAVADAVKGNWVDRHAPASWRPYLRLARADRPIGGWLLMWPCWWSAALAGLADGRAYPEPRHLLLFLIGAFVMRAAGCAYNDIVDRDIDAKVERTRSRPLPSGQITTGRAVLFMVALALAGFLVLITFNRFTIWLGIASLVIVAAYPFMKRITDWPQAVLGLAFSWGALMGWAAHFGELAWTPVILYAGTIAWVIGYDTIYAHQDKEDDALIGMKSTALRFGPATTRWLTALFALAWLAWLTATLLAGGGLISMTALAIVALQLTWQVTTLETSSAENCLERFRSNHLAGFIVFVGLAIDMALQALTGA